MFRSIVNRKGLIFLLIIWSSILLHGQNFGLQFSFGKEYFEDHELLLIDFQTIEPTLNIKRSGEVYYVGVNYRLLNRRKIQLIPEVGLALFRRKLTAKYSFPSEQQIRENLRLKVIRLEIKLPLQIDFDKFCTKAGVGIQQSLTRIVNADNGSFKFDELSLEKFYFNNWSVLGGLGYEINEGLRCELIFEKYLMNYNDIFDPFFETIRNQIRVNFGLVLIL